MYLQPLPLKSEQHSSPLRLFPKHIAALQWTIAMKTKKFFKEAAQLAAPFRITDGRKFRLKDYDSNSTGDLKEKTTPINCCSKPWNSSTIYRRSSTPRIVGPCCSFFQGTETLDELHRSADT